MDTGLEWINLNELPELIVLIGLLWLIGQEMTQPTEFSNRWVRRIGVATLLVYVVGAIQTRPPYHVADLLAILVRALLAAGMVGGLASILVPLFHPLFQKTFIVMDNRRLGLFARARQWLTQRRAAWEAERRRRRSALEAARQARKAEATRRQAAVEAARTERRRRVSTDKARMTVIDFFTAHESLLTEKLPRALFRAQLQTRFPSGIAAQQAWLATQEMITDMLPLVGEARQERQRKGEEQEAKRAQEKRPMTVPELTAWYEKTTREIEEHLPAGSEREDILNEVWDRYDELVKKTLRELQP